MDNNIIFEFKGKTFQFDRSTLIRWMAEPLGNAEVNFNKLIQLEAGFDLVSSEAGLDEREISLLEQMTPKDFARLFTVG